MTCFAFPAIGREPVPALCLESSGTCTHNMLPFPYDSSSYSWSITQPLLDSLEILKKLSGFANVFPCPQGNNNPQHLTKSYPCQEVTNVALRNEKAPAVNQGLISIAASVLVRARSVVGKGIGFPAFVFALRRELNSQRR